MPDEKVINLSDFKPHTTGLVECFACQHQWEDVAPAGTIEFKCPECGTFKGRALYECIKKDDLHFMCDCGNMYFCITQDGFYCPNCGVSKDGG